MNPDMINGLFELFGGLLYILNIRLLLIHKQVQGVSLIPTVFFTSWGIWNLFYYPSLDQWYSFYGGVFLVTVNAIWLFLALYYSKLYSGRVTCS